MSVGEVWSSVNISREYGNVKLEGFLLGDILGPGGRTEVVTYSDISGG